jgi:hypothetical protein
MIDVLKNAKAMLKLMPKRGNVTVCSNQDRRRSKGTLGKINAARQEPHDLSISKKKYLTAT